MNFSFFCVNSIISKSSCKVLLCRNFKLFYLFQFYIYFLKTLQCNYQYIDNKCKGNKLINYFHHKVVNSFSVAENFYLTFKRRILSFYRPKLRANHLFWKKYQENSKIHNFLCIQFTSLQRIRTCTAKQRKENKTPNVCACP